MNKNPIVVITGLAVAAVAGIAGLTKDKWMASPPQQVASIAAATAPAAATPAVEAPAQPPAAVEAPAVAPVAEPSATVAPPVTTAETPAAQPAAAQPAAAVVPAVEPPATAEVPAAQPEAEQPVTTDAPATQPAAEQPAAVTAPAIEAPAVEQQIAAVQPETTAPAPESTAPAAVVAAPAAVETVPAFDTVRVEKTGEAVIAGTAKAGSVVVVKLDGAAIGTAVANADGAFVVVPDAPLPAGSGALTIESKGKGDQLAVQSEQSVAVIIPAEAKDDALVAVVSPNEPTKILQKPQPEPEPVVAAAEPAAEATGAAQPEPVVEKPAASAAAPKLVSIDAVDYDSTGNIVFSGQGQAGNTARVYVDNTHTGDAVIAIDGRWSFAGTAAVGTGKHSLRVDGINTAGKVLNRVEVPFFREETSKVAAATPAEPATNQDAAKTDSEVAAAGEDAVANATVNPQITDASPLPPKEGRVVIQPGNNLWRISRVLYGSGEKYTLLYKANKDQIRDPDMIFPGQIFMTPDVAPKVDMIDPKRREPLKPEENAASVQ